MEGRDGDTRDKEFKEEDDEAEEQHLKQGDPIYVHVHTMYMYIHVHTCRVLSILCLWLEHSVR